MPSAVATLSARRSLHSLVVSQGCPPVQYSTRRNNSDPSFASSLRTLMRGVKSSRVALKSPSESVSPTLYGVVRRSLISSSGVATPTRQNPMRRYAGTIARSLYMERKAVNRSSVKGSFSVLSISSRKISTGPSISAATTSRKKRMNCCVSVPVVASSRQKSSASNCNFNLRAIATTSPRK